MLKNIYWGILLWKLSVGEQIVWKIWAFTDEEFA